MNTTNLSQQCSARTHFKALLLLTLLAGGASAQQSAMPPLAIDLPLMPALQAPPVGATLPSGFEAPVPPSLEASCVASLVTNEQSAETQSAETSRSTWTLRQHATWLLGLKPRPVMHNAIEPSLPEAPQVDIVTQVAIQPPTLEVPPSLTAMPDAVMPEPAVTDRVMLVQHTQYSAPPTAPAVNEASAVVTAAGQTFGNESPVEHALGQAPHSLNLRPVVSGPAPALPLEQMASESLLQVDVSGIDPSQLAPIPSAPESLIDSFGFRPPTGFSMRDSETVSLAASPAHAQPVSIHEGFTPRTSSANQPTQLHSTNEGHAPSSTRFSLSDKSKLPDDGAVRNRLSDKEPVHEKLADDATSATQQKVAKKQTANQAVEKSFSDKDLLLVSMPVEVSSDSEKTSRSSQLEVLTPPSRLAKDSPSALPLSSAVAIASTGVDADLPIRKSTDNEPKPVEPPVPPAAESSVAATTNVADRPVESLIDGLVPLPSLLKAETPSPSKTSMAATVPAAPTSTPAAEMPSPAPARVVAKTDAPKPAEKFALTDANPIALKRPVLKAANVSIPETSGTESTVVQSSHEMDDSAKQLAEYAKMAAKMQQAIKQKFPNCRVKITCNEDGLIAQGHVANNTEASKVLTFVRKTSLCPVADRVTTSQ